MLIVDVNKRSSSEYFIQRQLKGLYNPPLVLRTNTKIQYYNTGLLSIHTVQNVDGCVWGVAFFVDANKEIENAWCLQRQNTTKDVQSAGEESTHTYIRNK